MSDAERIAEVARLRMARRRSLVLRGSRLVVVVTIISSWSLGGFSPVESMSQRRLTNLTRFLGELRPDAVRTDLLAQRGWQASKQTLALSVAAIVLAGAAGMLLSLPAARNIAAREPFSHETSGLLWRAVVVATRLLLMFFRAIPEYVWAFLLLATLGQQAWPAVLALAIHNAGILGRLGAEVVENVEPAVPRALRDLGATRLQVALAGVVPLVLPRFLLYFFYRWETCVREATVLGLLGFTSLGYWIADARARDRYDEMLVYVLLGAALVLLGDVVSAVTRAFVRRAA